AAAYEGIHAAVRRQRRRRRGARPARALGDPRCAGELAGHSDARRNRALARRSGDEVMWPFDRGGPVLLLYVATLALHAVFVAYVVAGSAFLLVRRADPIAATVRDRLP